LLLRRLIEGELGVLSCESGFVPGMKLVECNDLFYTHQDVVVEREIVRRDMIQSKLFQLVPMSDAEILCECSSVKVQMENSLGKYNRN
jgi:hypothetical protein